MDKTDQLLLSVILRMGAMPLNMLCMFAATIDKPVTVSEFRMYEEISYGKENPIKEETGKVT